MVYSLEDIKKIIIPICIEYQIEKAGVFGSYGKGQATENSDVDLLFQFNERFDLFLYNQFLDELQTRLKKVVDVLDYRCIWEAFRDDIEKSEVRIYEYHKTVA